MLAAARKEAKKGLESVDVFDVFRGGKLPAGKKSVALGMVWRSSDKTLTDDEIEETMQRLMGAFERKLGAVIRK